MWEEDKHDALLGYGEYGTLQNTCTFNILIKLTRVTNSLLKRSTLENNYF